MESDLVASQLRVSYNSYMWELFVLVALVLQALESVIDKIAIIKNKAINSLGATFWRSFLFFFWCVLFGVTGMFGELKIFLTWPILFFALLWVGSSFFYTYQLKNIEISSLSLFSSTIPFFYLVIDTLLLHTNINPLQISGILFLVSGGFMLVIQPGKLKFRHEFTWKILCIFFYNFILGSSEYYGFKYYFNYHLLNEISFYFNTWLVVLIVFIIIISLQNKWKTIFNTIRVNHFFEKTMMSKGLDAMSSWLWLHAISFVAVSQVNSLGALYPIIFLGIVFIIQKVFGLKIGERLSPRYLKLKVVAVILLCAGGLLSL